MSADFRIALETALAERPRPAPASAFHMSLAVALATPRPADGDVIDLRFRALLADAIARRPGMPAGPVVVDLRETREVSEGDASERPLDASLT